MCLVRSKSKVCLRGFVQTKQSSFSSLQRSLSKTTCIVTSIHGFLLHLSSGTVTHAEEISRQHQVRLSVYSHPPIYLYNKVAEGVVTNQGEKPQLRLISILVCFFRHILKSGTSKRSEFWKLHICEKFFHRVER